MIATMVLPSMPGRAPTSSAAAMAAPDEMPTGMPSRRARLAGRLERCLVRDGDDFVDHAAVENTGHEACTDALNLVRARRAAGQHRRILRLQRDHAHRRLALFQHLSDAGDCAAGADAGNHDVDCAVRVVPDFLAPWCGDGSPGSPDFRIAAASPRRAISARSSCARATAPFMPLAARSARVRRPAGPASCAVRSTWIPASPE